MSAELTDELHFLKALALVGMFFQPKAGLRVLTLLRQEKVGNFCFLKISRMSCISTSAARFYGFSSNEVRFKGVRARPVGGAGDGVA